MPSCSMVGFWRSMVVLPASGTQGFFGPLLLALNNSMPYGDAPDSIGMAVAYMAGIVRNHLFVDGNKRTAFAVGILFLEMNGHRFTRTEEGAAQSVLELAAGTLDEASFARWLRANVSGSPR